MKLSTFFGRLFPRKNAGVRRPVDYYRPVLDRLEERLVMNSRLFAIGSPSGSAPLVSLFNSDSGELLSQVQPFSSSYTGGVNVTLADLNQDGDPEIIASAINGAPHVVVLDGATHSVTASFLAYGASQTSNIQVAAGDIGGGQQGIVVGSGGSMAGTVSVFSPTGTFLRSFQPYGSSYKGAVGVALGQGENEPVLATVAGSAGHVRVVGLESNSTLANFYGFSGFAGQTSLAMGDVNHDGIADVVLGAQSGRSHTKVFDGATFQNVASFFGSPSANSSNTSVEVVTVGAQQTVSVASTTSGTTEVRYFELGSGGGVTLVADPVPSNPAWSGYYQEGLGGFSLRVATSLNGLGVVAVGSDPGSKSKVAVYDPATTSLIREFTPFDATNQDGVVVAVGDLNGDGVADIVTAQATAGGLIRAFDGATQKAMPGKLGSFTGFTGTDGVSIAVADVNGDGFADIVAGTQGSGPKRIRIWSGPQGALIRETTLDQTDLGDGLRIAAGDVNLDGRADIAVAAGKGGSSRVRVLDGSNGAEIGNFYVFDPNETRAQGLQIAVGDVNGDGFADIIASDGQNKGSEVRVISGSDWTSLSSQVVFSGQDTNVRLGAADLDGDGTAEILASQGAGAHQALALKWSSGETLTSFTPFASSGANAGSIAGPSGSSGGGMIMPFSTTPSVSISTTTPIVVEGDTVYLTLTLSNTSTFPCGGYLSYGGTATNGTGVDYYWNTGFSISSGKTSTTISFPTYTDNLVEGDETIVITISSTVYCTVGSPSSVTIRLVDLNFPSTTLPVESCSDPASLIQNGPGVAAGGNPVRTTGGVIGANGSIDVPLGGDLVGATCSAPVGDALSWSSQPGNSSADLYGNNVLSRARPYLVKDSTSRIGVIESASKTYVFDYSGGVYTARYYLQNTLTYSSGTGLYTLTDTVGNTMEFYDFSTSLPSAQRGQVKRRTDAAGNVTDYTYDGNGKLTDYQQATTVGSTTTTESFAYTYLSSGTNSGKVDAVTFRRKVNSGSWETVRSAQYSYYDTGSSNGNAGDLKFIDTKDSSGAVISTQYLRYYTTASSTGYVGGLKYVFSGPSYERLKGVYSTPDTATDAQVTAYADANFEYNSNQWVTKAVIQGQGCPVCTGGLGEYTYAYSTSSFANGYNNWRTKTVETLPDGNQNIVFSNFAGEPMLLSFKEVSTGNEWITYNKYDDAGRVVLTANPSAVSGYDETKGDLLNNQSGNYQYLNDSSGLIATRSYSTSTTATDSMAGTVNGYLSSTNIRQGETSSDVSQGSSTYISRTLSSLATYLPASSTVYRNADGTGSITTSNAYTWVTGTRQLESITTTNPTVTTAQNGSNAATSAVVVLNNFQQPIWIKDAAGYITFRAYDQATKTLIKEIVDVDTTQTTTFNSLPSGWSTPSGAGLHLTTSYEVDSLGRATKITYPNGRVDYAIFKDASHEVRQYLAWDATNNGPLLPIQVSRQDWTNGYTENLTMSATPSVTSGKPNGTESISSLESLARAYTNTGGQVINKDAYFDFTGLTYSTSTTLGTENTNFYRTVLGYDTRGRQNKVQLPTGTVYRTYIDPLGRQVSQWVGLDDTPTSGLWSPTNTTGTDLVKISENEYDGGGLGDSNLTKVTQIPGGSAANRVTQYFLDWRNRVVATKTGVETSEATDTNRLISYLDYDNLNRVTTTRLYDGDTVSITSTSGVPNAPSSSLLRAKSETQFDERDQAYKTLTYSVDPSTGSVSSSALTTQSWFDPRGLVIKQSSPGGLVTKTTYDGAARPTASYSTDGGGDTVYTDAYDVTGDAVLQQVENTYDSNSHVVLVTAKQRFHDETGTGALGTASTGVKARVSYAASYYDGADRLTNTVDVGTNGGSSYTRPSTVPSRSDTVLVVTTAYNSAGLAWKVTDPRGIEFRYYFDALVRVTKTIENYVDGTVSDTDDKTTESTYNAVGRTTVKVSLPSSGQQVTEWVYGVTTSGGSGLNSNDLVKEVRYPDPSTGASSSSSKDVLTVNALGQALTMTDRNGTVHTSSYDVLGRQTADAITTLGSGVDGTVRRLATAYDTQGNPYLFTAYDASSGGNIVNQVKRDFNGLGQLTSEWQSHSGAVTGSSPRVQYAYSEMPSGANHSRLTSVTYASGYVVNYNYASGLDANISRLSSLSDASNTLEGYSYLGLVNVVKRAYSQPGVDLSYIKLTGESVGDAGDQYTGLDRFGRIVDQRWINGSNTDVDRYQYGYDRDGNRLYKDNKVIASLSEVYTYDSLNQLATYKLGTLNGCPLNEVRSSRVH